MIALKGKKIAKPRAKITFKGRSYSTNIYKEAEKLSVHYATFPALLPYLCRMHKEQNDQIQESDAGASVRVSGQNRPCPCPPYCFLHIGAT